MKLKELIKELELLDSEKEVVVESDGIRSELISITEDDVIIIEGL
jgi:hypothetical protein